MQQTTLCRCYACKLQTLLLPTEAKCGGLGRLLLGGLLGEWQLLSRISVLFLSHFYCIHQPPQRGLPRAVCSPCADEQAVFGTFDESACAAGGRSPLVRDSVCAAGKDCAQPASQPSVSRICRDSCPAAAAAAAGGLSSSLSGGINMVSVSAWPRVWRR